MEFEIYKTEYIKLKLFVLYSNEFSLKQCQTLKQNETILKCENTRIKPPLSNLRVIVDDEFSLCRC